ncbi:MAG: KH domain-containing protein, partial [Acidimicrobiaceae bacterium]|nr:KH domain-containing protein [Acidimicrobiaceae bacterium]
MSADLAPEAQDLLRHVVASIVENPDAVSIDVSEDDDTIRFDVSVGDGDMGRV